MRTILLGTDFMYNADGNLVPIEMNTNASMDGYSLEDHHKIFDLTDLASFIKSRNFTKVVYIGQLWLFEQHLIEWGRKNDVEIKIYRITGTSMVPYVEDTDDVLIIRSAFDSAAIVDTEYCVNKVNFLNLIKSTEFGAQFAYMGDDGQIVSNITKINDFGNHPNFILKAVHPHYDKNSYPKFFNVKNQEELDVVLKNVNSEFFLMEMYFDPKKLHNNQVKVYRSYNILFPPDLDNISLGGYFKISKQKLKDGLSYNPVTFELDHDERYRFLNTGIMDKPKLVDGDLVEMADGTFKGAEDLQVGDLVKTIDIPNPHDTNLSSPCNDYQIDYEEFLSGTTISENKITQKIDVSSPVDYVTITFTDGTTWSDTAKSSYLTTRDGNVQFGQLFRTRTLDGSDQRLCAIKEGDQVILLESGTDEIRPVLKTIDKIKYEKKVFEGWEIGVERRHLFLTKSSESDSSYVAIEHNKACSKWCCTEGCDLCTYPDVCCTSYSCIKLISCFPYCF